MKRVLLIEDDVWLGQSFERSLKQEFEVETVETISHAVEAINAHLPDLIVADYMLQGYNSITLLHELRSYEDTARIPIILCSTLGAELAEYELQLQNYGVKHICDKATLTPASLRRAVKEVLATGISKP